LQNPGKCDFLTPFLTEDGWKSQLGAEFEKDYFIRLDQDLKNEYTSKPSQIFPPQHQIFNAFNLTPFSDVSICMMTTFP
jgi:uracil-DNA glycosylase